MSGRQNLSRCLELGRNQFLVRPNDPYATRAIPLSMIKYMLDTDTVSYVLRKHAPVCDRVICRRPRELCISSISLAELRYGAAHVNSRKLHNLIDGFISAVEVLPFD